MTSTDIATIVGSYTTVAAIVGGIAWKSFKKAVDTAIAERKEQIAPMEELRHNGGSSLLDVVKLQILPMVKELKSDLKEVRENQIIIGGKVDKLEGRFEQHVDETQE